MLHKILAVALALVLLLPVVGFAAPREQERLDAGTQTVVVTGDVMSLVQYVLSLLPTIGPAPMVESEPPNNRLN